MKIDPEIWSCGPDSLNAFANTLENIALAMRQRADAVKRAHVQSDDINARLEFIHTEAPRAVRRFLSQGKPLADSLLEAANLLNLPFETVELHWKRFMKNKDKDALDKRALLVFEMARQGMTNALIAARLGLHPVTVSRIINAEKRQRLLISRESISSCAQPSSRPFYRQSSRRGSLS